MKVFLSIGAFLLASTTLVAAFSSHPLQSSCARVQQPAATFTVFAAEDDSEVGLAEDGAVTSEETPKVAVKCPDCELCDGSGRILGGIGTVLTWWPIKAYRPCPNFIENGGRYVRSGQGLDEIAFGRDSTFQLDE
eukprot:CAMPEP_0201730848 /NCGR_PEP_ID=MMETSP0593-20130828/23811_1 /ASSEMBLY_ACC=CAM_ASM_000672 /TAXON_ID=267983 /ORGANISM="Skeletonema japonicum, Strain CCMP2506" /LENGTH=134 /DNA_ID=CAMNT_0048223501 /DNA_START=100 /DNA_END=504 /DNA_ORIENTATION=-